MSRAYEVAVEIKVNKKVNHKTAVVNALDELWSFEWESFNFKGGDKLLRGFGEGTLGIGTYEDKFAQELAEAAFEANQGPLDLTVRTVCLEELPYEEFEFGNKEYRDFQRKKRKEAT